MAIKQQSNLYRLDCGLCLDRGPVRGQQRPGLRHLGHQGHSVSPGQVRSGQVRSSQVRSGQVRSGQVRLVNQIGRLG